MHGWVPILNMIGLGAGFGAFNIIASHLVGPRKPFALALKSLGWVGFIQILVFFGLLVTGYIYVWRKGVLDWGHERV